MNLEIKGVISIVKNKVAYDHRKGVNNARIESNLFPTTKCCVFTAPYGDGVTLRVLFDNQDEMEISFDESQMEVFANLIEPYITAKK